VKQDEMIGGSIVFIFGGITAILSLQMPLGTFRMAGPGLFPLCLGVFLMILSAILIANVKFGKKSAGEKPGEITQAPRSTRQMLLFLGGTVLAVAGFDTLGFPLTSFLLMVLLLRSLGIKKWPFLIIMSLATAIASYIIFVQLLKIPLPKGLIGI
jgi:hypothetical protein